MDTTTAMIKSISREVGYLTRIQEMVDKNPETTYREAMSIVPWEDANGPLSEMAEAIVGKRFNYNKIAVN